MATLALRQPWFRRARCIAAYLSNDAEIDPYPLLRLVHAEGKCLLLPRLRGRRLEFVRYRPSAGALRRNRFGIPEPVGLAVPLQRIDVICMPLVGFDRHGGRLGMGGGFYDRTLVRNASGGRARKPRLIGLAYACQELAQLPCESFDVRLAGVITEREWIPISR